MADFAGKKLAFDAWNILYQFLASIRQPDGTPLMDREGNVTSHLAGTLYRTANLVEAGIQPVFCFDGEPHPLKKETLAARSARKEKAQGEYDAALASHDAAKAAGDEASAAAALETARSKAQQTSRLTVPMVKESQELLAALGIPFIQAPGEGEAQGAAMARAGTVHAVVSQDFDALLFGTPRLVRYLGVGGRRKLPGKQVWVDAAPEEVGLEASLAALRLTREQLVDCALLVGTDFHPGVRGIGAKKAVATIQKEGSLEAFLGRLASEGPRTALEKAVLEQQDALRDREEVRRIFLQPAHKPGPPPPAGRLDRAAVLEIMVERHGFSKDRVETALERYKAAQDRGRQATLF